MFASSRRYYECFLIAKWNINRHHKELIGSGVYISFTVISCMIGFKIEKKVNSKKLIF